MKKVVSLLLASLMVVCIFAGCTNNGEAGTGGSSSVNTDYMSWNTENWNSANDEEKEACTLAYLMCIADLMGQGDTVTEEMMKPQVENMLPAVDALFKAMPSTGYDTLQDLTKASYEAYMESDTE